MFVRALITRSWVDSTFRWRASGANRSTRDHRLVTAESILRDPSITKFLHAGSEDLEVFLNVFGELPQPLIDTQILAAFCGRPMSWGFASMVEEYSGVTLDKSESRTDWLARPLTERQCEYAAADVWYLLPITAKLMVETEASAGYLRRWMNAA